MISLVGNASYAEYNSWPSEIPCVCVIQAYFTSKHVYAMPWIFTTAFSRTKWWKWLVSECDCECGKRFHFTIHTHIYISFLTTSHCRHFHQQFLWKKRTTNISFWFFCLFVCLFACCLSYNIIYKHTWTNLLKTKFQSSNWICSKSMFDWKMCYFFVVSNLRSTGETIHIDK